MLVDTKHKEPQSRNGCEPKHLEALGLIERLPEPKGSAEWLETELLGTLEEMARAGDDEARALMRLMDTPDAPMREMHRRAMAFARRVDVPWKGAAHLTHDLLTGREQIDISIERLACAGLVEFANTFRRGQPVWKATELSQVLEALDGGDAYRHAVFNAGDVGQRDDILRMGVALAERAGVPWRGLDPSSAADPCESDG